ncbi:MAG: N-acetyltransferase [Alphaproteobacteria bacterium]|jgi:predicted N-acetyltransferase YhbS|nr:N-acetyltransferase [Alphaproteobacteria bacterium]
MYQITTEQPGDGPEIEKLLDQSFGPDRRRLTAYRLRGDAAAVAELCFVLRGARLLCASIRYWPIVIAGRHPALLLGPLAVGRAWRGRGLGKTLIRHSLARARVLGHEAVLVIGDVDYYRPFGFSDDYTGNLSLPSPVEPGRFQGCELVPGALSGLSGPVAPAGPG